MRRYRPIIKSLIIIPAIVLFSNRLIAQTNLIWDQRVGWGTGEDEITSIHIDRWDNSKTFAAGYFQYEKSGHRPANF